MIPDSLSTNNRPWRYPEEWSALDTSLANILEKQEQGTVTEEELIDLYYNVYNYD